MHEAAVALRKLDPGAQRAYVRAGGLDQDFEVMSSGDIRSFFYNVYAQLRCTLDIDGRMEYDAEDAVFTALMDSQRALDRAMDVLRRNES